MRSEFDGVSFIIPAFNEENFIQQTIDAINALASQLCFPYEIIVIDNGSTDKTCCIAESLPCKLDKIKKSKVSFARNYGAKRAKFSLFAFIDADTVITEKWLAEMKVFLSTYSREDKVLTGCPVSIPKEPSWIEKSWFNNTSKNYIGGANIICTKALFLELKGFDETLETGEDYDFCKRARSLNSIFNINSRFEAIHLGFPSSIYDFSKREIWHGKGDCKSLNTFFSSKVSIMAMLYLILLFFAFFLVFLGDVSKAFLMVFILASLNLFLTFKRFGPVSFDKFCFNFLLNFIYFLSRSISLFAVVKEKLKTKLT